MESARFDSISRRLASRKISRRTVLASGGAGLALATAGSQVAPAVAQPATPAASPVATEGHPAFLFVQSFRSGSLVPKGAAGVAPAAGGEASYTLTLSEGLGQTVFFSDRPERIVGTVPTPDFLATLGFDADNPPNAALVAQTGDGNEEILIVELINPVYDDASRTATYDVRLLQDDDVVDMNFTQDLSTAAHSDTSYGASHLFIDDCNDGWIRCFNNELQERTLGDIAVHKCWVWSELQCFPCSTGDDFGKMEQMCLDVYGDECEDRHCGAGVLGGA